MKHLFVIALICITILTFSSINTKAYTIRIGTKSLSGSTSSIFETRNLKKGDDRDTFDFDLKGGYFVIDNLELGASFSFYMQDTENYRERTYYSLAPYITYHQPLNNISNLYLGAEIGFAHLKNEYDSGATSKEDSPKLSANLGWEYFLNPYVAMNVGLSYDRIEWDLENYSVEEDTEDIFKLEWGLIIYFHNSLKLR